MTEKPAGLIRARLLASLRQPARLTLITAPAGYGRTTLLTRHADRPSHPVV